MVCERSDAFASACALARAFPLFSHRAGTSRRTDKTVTVEFFLVGQDNGPVEVSTLQVGVRTFTPCPRAPGGWPAGRAVWGARAPSSGEAGGLPSFPRRPRGLSWRVGPRSLGVPSVSGFGSAQQWLLSPWAFTLYC